MTPKDRADLEAALVTGVDWIALSFVQRAEDVLEAKKLIRGRAAVMSKIEKPQAIDRLPEILEASDALMVARGDLGVELPLERVPSLQKQMTRLARRAGKPVVVATQMLESMIQSPVPTRAEVSDVATAVYEGADAIMLSAESAAGKFPVEAVATMNRIGEKWSAIRPIAACSTHSATEPEPTVGDAIADAARQIAETLDLSAIICWTSSGSTALRVARERPKPPVVAITPNLVTDAGCPPSGACIAWSPKTPRISTTWSAAPAVSPFATASPGQASASSSSPAYRSVRPARPTWCASPRSVLTATPISEAPP